VSEQLPFDSADFPPEPEPVPSPPPFLPPTPEEEPIPPAPWRVFQVPGFPQLFGAQTVSSLGDWVGLLAILSIAGRVSTYAVAFVMFARMLPGFILAPLGGALVDRWNRKVVMVSCDLGRAALLAILPFWEHILSLILISFAIECLTLLWGPAKDASVPNIVQDPELLAPANSFGLVASFGTFPLAAIVFALMGAVASWLGGFDALNRLHANQEALAIWVDGLTFVCSALLISRLVLSNTKREQRERPPVAQTWRDMVDGLKFIREQPLVRGVMIGLAGGLLGTGMIIPLGTVFAKQVLGAKTTSAFGWLQTALGCGAAVGVVTLLWLQRRLPREQVFTASVAATGATLIVLACVSTLSLAILLVAAIGAGAGCGYVTGFTLLQESVSDDMRGRTFGMLYTVVRVCLLLSLTLGPLVAAMLGSISGHVTNNEIALGGAHFALPGVRLTLWLGGALTVVSGLAARRRIHKAHAAVAAE
jgi:dTMP kinase